MQNTGYIYYLVDCVNGSDENDGIKKPFKTLDKVFSVNTSPDLRIRFLSPGVYPTAAQHFSGLSMHWDAGSAEGAVVVEFCGRYPNKRIQFYNCYTHLKHIQIRWDPANQLYFETGYCAIGDQSAFISDVVRFNGMFMYADTASFYRLIVRESFAKLHNIFITKPGTDTENAIHGRDSFITLYGSIDICERMAESNEAAVIHSDRGRVYISTSPTEETGYQYGIFCGNTELYIAEKYLDAFRKYSLKGNSISTPSDYRVCALEKRISELEKKIK